MIRPSTMEVEAGTVSTTINTPAAVTTVSDVTLQEGGNKLMPKTCKNAPKQKEDVWINKTTTKKQRATLAARDENKKAARRDRETPVDEGRTLTTEKTPVDEGAALTIAKTPVGEGRILTTVKTPVNSTVKMPVDEGTDEALEAFVNTLTTE